MCADVAGPISEELQAAAALLHGEAQGVKSAALLSRVLINIISKPGEEKYRWDVVQCVNTASQSTFRHMRELAQASTAEPHKQFCHVPCASGSCG